MNIEQKLGLLKDNIKSLGSLAVAFSGGVDSTFLLAVAKDVFDDNVIAVTARDCTYPERETRKCVELALKLGVRHIVLPTDQLNIPGFAANPHNRCYLCKKNLFEKIMDLARENGISCVADGSNSDDTGDFRPGMRALQELGVASPLLEVGLGKEEIRLLSRRLGLETWNKPAAACLSSRFVFGEAINRDKLQMIDRAEQYILNHGFSKVRVRLHDELARIEVGVDELNRFGQENMMEEVNSYFKKLGFRYVTLDLQGYRTGSMNEALNENYSSRQGSPDKDSQFEEE